MQASCSVRLVQHSLLAASIPPPDRALIPQEFWGANPESRVALSHAHAPLIAAAERLSDDQLGLKLGGALRFGAGGAFDYAVRSAPTLRESTDIARRFMRLVADSASIAFETFQRRAIVRFDVDPVWPKVVAEFAVSAWFKIHMADQITEDAHPECWFPYPAPRDTSAYRRIFTGAALRFDAPLLGLVVDEGFASASTLGADPALHAIHCERVESLLAGLSGPDEMRAIVRRILERELENESPTAESVARMLHMSRSTMTRRLESEGTDFTTELDRVRRQRALRYIRDASVPITEVAFLSGFRHVESFYRAFARWMGQTPRAFRAMAQEPTAKASEAIG
jgi:AraC-like DNA-binding protein